MNLPPLLTLTYWLNPSPPPFATWSDTLIFSLFILMTIGGMAVQVYRMRALSDRMMKRAADEVGTLLLITGIAGLIIHGMSYEQIPYLSMRIWYVAWAGWVAVWGQMVYKFIAIEIPRIKNEKTERADFFKWLPKHR